MENNTEALTLLKRIVEDWDADELGVVDRLLIERARSVIRENQRFTVEFTGAGVYATMRENLTEEEVKVSLAKWVVAYDKATVWVDGLVVQVFKRDLGKYEWYASARSGELLHLATLTERPTRDNGASS